MCICLTTLVDVKDGSTAVAIGIQAGNRSIGVGTGMSTKRITNGIAATATTTSTITKKETARPGLPPPFHAREEG